MAGVTAIANTAIIHIYATTKYNMGEKRTLKNETTDLKKYTQSQSVVPSLPQRPPLPLPDNFQNPFGL